MDAGIRAARLQLARDRIRVATLALVERHGLHDHSTTMADADRMPVAVRDVYQLEAVAALLDALVLTEAVKAEDATPESELAALSSVGPQLAEKLTEAGITNVVTLSDASDDELLAIDGVGRSTLRRIRAEIGQAR